MYRSIYRFRVISALIFSLVAFNVSASPCFSDNSVTKGTQIGRSIPLLPVFIHDAATGILIQKTPLTS